MPWGSFFCRCNVVGYFQKTQPAFKDQAQTLVYPTGIISFQWDKVDGTTKKLNEILKCNVAVASYPGGVADPNWYNNAPKIQVRLASGEYSTLYYCSDAWNVDHEEEGWATDTGIYDNETIISLGQGAWFSSPVEDATLTIAGAVAGTEIAVGGDGSGATILAGGSFPVAFKVNAANVTWNCTPVASYPGGVADPNWYNNAPKIQVRLSSGEYSTLYYCSDAWNVDHEEQGWATDTGIYDNETNVEVGGGFWMSVPSTVHGGVQTIYVTVKNPLAE